MKVIFAVLVGEFAVLLLFAGVSSRNDGSAGDKLTNRLEKLEKQPEQVKGKTSVEIKQREKYFIREGTLSGERGDRHTNYLNIPLSHQPEQIDRMNDDNIDVTKMQMEMEGRSLTRNDRSSRKPASQSKQGHDVTDDKTKVTKRQTGMWGRSLTKNDHSPNEPGNESKQVPDVADKTKITKEQFGMWGRSLNGKYDKNCIPLLNQRGNSHYVLNDVIGDQTEATKEKAGVKIRNP